MNVDIGNQAHGGSNAVVIGDLTTTNTDCFNTQYTPKILATSASLTVASDASGTLWIFTGADSGFEGHSSLYFTQVQVRVRARHPGHHGKGDSDEDDAD